MGYEGLPTADWRCLANGRVAAQACVCRLWAVACVASGSGQWRERIRGGLTAGPSAWPPAFGVHDDALYKSTAFTFTFMAEFCAA